MSVLLRLKICPTHPLRPHWSDSKPDFKLWKAFSIYIYRETQMRLQRCSLGLKKMNGNGTYWDADLHSFVRKRWEWIGHRIQVKKLGHHSQELLGFPWWPSCYDSMLPVQEAEVPCLVGEDLACHMVEPTTMPPPPPQKKRKKKVTIPFVSWGTLPSIGEDTEDTNGSEQNQAFQSREPFALAAFWPLSAPLGLLE